MHAVRAFCVPRAYGVHAALAFVTCATAFGPEVWLAQAALPARSSDTASTDATRKARSRTRSADRASGGDHADRHVGGASPAIARRRNRTAEGEVESRNEDGNRAADTSRISLPMQALDHRPASSTRTRCAAVAGNSSPAARLHSPAGRKNELHAGSRPAPIGCSCRSELPVVVAGTGFEPVTFGLWGAQSHI